MTKIKITHPDGRPVTREEVARRFEARPDSANAVEAKAIEALVARAEAYLQAIDKLVEHKSEKEVLYKLANHRKWQVERRLREGIETVKIYSQAHKDYDEKLK